MKRQKNNNSVGRRKIFRRNTQSSTSTYVRETLPMDLIIEILLRLPAKSIAICGCVSKQWSSLIRRPDFTELFLTNSLSRPLLLFTFRFSGKWGFLSSSHQPRDLGGNLSIVATDYQYHMSYCEDRHIEICQSVHGFIYMKDIGVSKGKIDKVDVIYNPCTGQHITLPEVEAKNCLFSSFFGYDPIGKQFKVLCIPISYNRHTEPQVLTIGTGELSWRKIECSFLPYHKAETNGVCINGVLYYIAYNYIKTSYNTILGFDVRSEKFSCIEIKEAKLLSLINYKGKLGVVLCFDNGTFAELWVLDDAKKVKWSKHIFILPNPVLKGIKSIWATDTGEIGWALSRWTHPLYVFYYNLEMQSVRRVEIKGIEDKLLMGRDHQKNFFTFTNHVENLMFL